MEIGTVEVGGSRRGRNAAAGSQHSGQNSNSGFGPSAGRPMTGGINKPAPMGGLGGGDILDDALSRGNRNDMFKDRSQNLLSDAGSRFGDDDAMSHFMGQSEYGGAS